MKEKPNKKHIFKRFAFITISIIAIILILLLSIRSCSTPTYTITFKNYDGTIIDVIEVKNGEIPSTNKIPSKPSDDEYEYLFDSWGNIVRANGDATYQAVFINKLINNKEDSDIKIDNKEDDDNSPTDKEGLYYYINFLDDDGTVIESSTFKYGSIPYCTKDIPNKTKDGYLYTFAGWNKTLSRVTGNTTYRATYNKTYIGGGGGGSSEPSVTKYTVSFVLEPGQGTAPSNQQVPSGSKATQPSINCGGYIIEHWYEDNAYTTEWNFSTGTITEAKTLYGKWENKYAVTFDYKGKGTNNFVAVTNGSTVTKPSDPSYTGYEFITWQYYTESHGVQVLNVYDFASTVDAPLTLYAQWGVKLIFNTQGKGTVLPAELTVSIGDIISAMSTPSPTDESQFAFNGWYKESACTHPFDSSQPINGPGPITLYAGWNYVITFNLKGHGTMSPINVEPGSKIPTNVMPDNPTATGYVFKGWYTDDALTTPFNINNVINAPTTLYAKWVEAVTITFDCTGLSNTIDPILIEKGTKIPVPTVFVDSGYLFKGWYATNNFTGSQWDFDTTVSENKTLYARVEIIVSFDLHGHGGDPIRNITVKPQGTIPEQSVPTDSNYVFMGWWKEDTYENLWDFTNDLVSEPITLHAKWGYNVTFDLQGKGDNTVNKVGIGETVSAPTSPSYTDYLFKGWYKDQACSADKKWNFNTVVTNNMSLYAKWVAIPKKGDIIKLIDGKEYRVLDINNNNAFVLSLSNASNSPYWSVNQTVDFDTDVSGTKYEGSTLDNYLENTWFAALDDSTGANITKPIHDAIQETNVVQSILTYHSSSPTNDNYVAKGPNFIGSVSGPYYITEDYNAVTIEDRHVFVLGVKEIADYLGKDNITKTNLREMFKATSGYYRLNSAAYGQPSFAWMIDFNNSGGFLNFWRSTTYSDVIRPAFYINIANEDVNYDLTAIDKYTITTDVNDENMGSVKITGGPNYNVGTEVVLTPQAKSGYMFVKWDDENTDNPRTVIANETNSELTFKAIFEEKIPTKGDIVTLGGKKYRVLSYDSSNGYAKLLSLYDLKTDQQYYEGDVATATIGDYTVAKYDGSDLDTYLNTTWYNNLNSVIQNAIINDTSLKQDIYCVSNNFTSDNISTVEIDNGFGSYTYYVYDNNNQGISISKKVYAPGMSDIIAYLGKNNLTINNVKNMFYESGSSSNTIWLRSGVYDISDPSNTYCQNCACTTDANEASHYSDSVDAEHAVHAMFTINLKATGIEYDLIKVPKYTVTVSADDESHGSVEGGGTFNEFTNVTITATPKEGYAFVNWNGDEYDTWNPKSFSVYEDTDLVANFIKMPSKGDVIQLNDGENYRILKTDGSKATVVGQYSLDQKAYATSPQTTTFGGSTGIDFYDSTLYDYVYDWANDLWNIEATRPMSSGMYSVDVIQGLYSYNDGSPTDDNYAVRGMKTNGNSYYLTGGATGDGYLAWSYAYPLDVSHFVDYLGEDNLTKKNINNMLFNSDDSTASLWLTSADGNSSSNALYYDASNGVISSDVASATHDVYPAFIIDLTYSGVEYDIVSEASKHTITVASNDDDMGSVRMTGGPEFIDGTEVLLTAKPIFGYKFSKWKINGVDDDSADKNNATRYITVSADKTYTAVFEAAETASHGDVIMFGTDEDHKYRVLKLDGNKALVVTYFDGEKTPYWESTAQTTDAFADPTLTGVKYDGSTLDDYLNTTWFDNQTSDLQGAIVEKTDLLQRIFKKDTTDPTTQNPPQILVAKGEYNTDFSNYYISSSDSYDSVNVGDRNVFALDLQDIVDYFDGDIVTSDKLKAVFGYQPGHKFWLRSAVTPEESSAWIVDGSTGSYEPCVATNADEIYARPAFYVDLSKIEFKVDNNIEGYPINVSSSDENKGTVSSSSTECNEGATVTISATPKDGYKFVEWSDGNRNNPRTIVVTGELTCNAVFAEIVMPTKGQVIKVDNKRYRVLSIDDSNKALVLGLYSISPDGGLKFYLDAEPPNVNNHTYDGSNLDNYLWNWYEALDSNSSLKKGIVQTDGLTQSVVGTITGTPADGDPDVIAKGIDSNSGEYYIKNYDPPITLSSFRYVFVLDVIDIIDYLGSEEDINAEKLKTMYDSTETYRIWLRSGITDDTESPNIAAVVNLEYGSLDKQNVEQSSLVYPSFYIDLSLISSEFDIEQPAP